LYPGATAHSLDLDLLDKRDFAPVGYKRVNKRSGKEVATTDIVKGYQHQKGEYVVVSEEDIRQANVKATQTIDIQAFVEAAAIAPYYFDTPYYLEPGKRGQKGYALLRDTLSKSDRIGIAYVVLRARQHLAAVIPRGRLLVLNTLRFADEIRPIKGLELPEEKARAAGVTPKEMEMAARLVEDMTEPWKPQNYKDTFRDDLLARIEKKVKSGQTHEVLTADEEDAPRQSAKVIDLMSALKRSLDTTQRPHKASNDEGSERPRRAPARRAVVGSRRTSAVTRARKRA
jgi:DNA end-binding protein Ku